MNINDIVNDGFVLHKKDFGVKGMAILSLQIALKSFFSTYRVMRNNFNLCMSQNKNDYFYSNEYNQVYSKTIVYFQNFFELVIKDFLRMENEMLVLKIQDPILIYKLIEKEEVSEEELCGINTLEFNTAYNYFKKLVNTKRIHESGVLDFLTSEEVSLTLIKLNNLRNRIIHRGSYVLKYESLDILIARYILPIVKQIIQLDEYSSYNEFCNFQNIYLRIDPIDEMIDSVKGEEYDFSKLAYMKEIARASYSNPLKNEKKVGGWANFNKYYNDKVIARTMDIALFESKTDDATDIRICPVCGQKTLVIYKEDDADYDIIEGEQVITSAWWVSHLAICYCCSFEVNRYLKNPKECGINMDDLWIGETVSYN